MLCNLCYKSPLTSWEDWLCDACRETAQNSGKKCNFCNCPVADGCCYCDQCAEQGKECKRCHRPLPEQYYAAYEDDTCKTCKSKNFRRSALGQSLEDFNLPPDNDDEKYDEREFLSRHLNEVVAYLREQLQRRKALKFHLVLRIRLVKTNPIDGRKMETLPAFHSATLTLLAADDIETRVREAFTHLLANVDKFIREGSGWHLEEVLELIIKVGTFHAARGTSYVATPKWIQNTRSVVNVKNQDHKCFMYAVLSALHPASDHTDRVSMYNDYVSELDFTGLSFPMKITAIAKFERLNPSVSVNVDGLEGKTLYPLYVTAEKKSRHVNLLLLGDGHYVWIKNMSALRGHETKYKGKMFYCTYCKSPFKREHSVVVHEETCKTFGLQRTKMPQPDSVCKFKNIGNKLPAPFVIYADFESIIMPLKEKCGMQTEKESLHIPCGFCMYTVCRDAPQYSSIEPKLYRGEAVAKSFLEHLKTEICRLVNILDEPVPLVMTDEDETNFQQDNICYFCEKQICDQSMKVRDHNHLTGQYRGPAHSYCNIQAYFKGKKKRELLQHLFGGETDCEPNTEAEKQVTGFQTKYIVPIVIHNLRGYDAHIIMEAVGKIDLGEVKVIAQTSEKYISFSLGSARFIDSLQFLNRSLDELVKGVETFEHVGRYFEGIQKEMLTRKGVYPYEYMDSVTRFQETCLPPIQAFYSTLTGEGISEESYKFAQKVWSTFDLETLGDYHDLYLLTDVLLLADVFENFRSLALREYGLDPAHYFTAPGLAWDAALKMSGVHLELLSDIDMHQMIEKGIRGGVAMITHRYAERKEGESELLYLDANNLYGYAMEQKLPLGGFEWVQGLPTEGTNYIAEVDLEYPEHLHELHNDFPLAPENVEIRSDMVSPYAAKLATNLKGVLGQKLIPHFGQRKSYVLHGRALQLYLSLGMVLSRVHRVVQFKEEAWLQPYIEKNTTLRAAAITDFERDFFKLMNNAVFGKTMERVRNRINYKLVTDEKTLRRHLALPSYKTHTIFHEKLVGVSKRVVQVTLNKPIYIGQTILDLSKVLMYDFHYHKILPLYGTGRLKLLFTDTDSLLYHLMTPNLYADLEKIREDLDTSNYPHHHPLYTAKNKKVVGKFKDECGGQKMAVFCGLRAKMYCYKMANKKASKRAKGVNKSVIKKLTVDDYLRALKTGRVMKKKGRKIRSYGHQLVTEAVNKIALSAYDDKRYILDDGISTLAHGHKLIRNLELSQFQDS